MQHPIVESPQHGNMEKVVMHRYESQKSPEHTPAPMLLNPHTGRLLIDGRLTTIVPACPKITWFSAFRTRASAGSNAPYSCIIGLCPSDT